MALRWKGELSDDRVHMTAEQYIEHRVQEQFYEEQKELRKLANNPALSNEAKKIIRKAISVYQDKIYWRNQAIQYMAMYRAVKGGKE